jgi:hypothetical protein
MDDVRIELIVDSQTGRLRQAGTIDNDGHFLFEIKATAEQSLYFFSRVIMGRDYLTELLHLPICNWLQHIPPYRKMLLLPRRHAKTSLVSHCLPPHMIIQPHESNLYFPGRAGCDLRILQAQESADRAINNMRTVQAAFEGNALLRGLWPEVCWENPRRDAKKWNERALSVRRNIEYPDPTLSTIGITGAITGGRFDVIIKDDIIAEEAANSEIVMEHAIRWHRNSRALFDDPDRSIEMIVGTRWAVRDLYHVIIQDDPSVEVMCRSIVEEGEPIYPEVFSLETVHRLRNEFGSMFPLLFMNQAADPELVDFPEESMRTFSWTPQGVAFTGDARDHMLQARSKAAVVDAVAASEMLVQPKVFRFRGA